MRIAFYTLEASTLAWQRRIFDEGTEILVYHDKPANRPVGRGIVPIATSLDQWLAFGNADPQTVWFFDCTDKGELADRLRKLGKHVVGGGTFMDRLENDRAFGAKIAQQAGIQAPPTKEFGTVSASVAYMKSTKQQEVGDGGWAWKPNRDLGASTTYVGDTDEVVEFCERTIREQFGDNVSCIVQERVKGVALSTARWWNGVKWTGPYEGTLEEKKFLDGDLGPATGCSFNALWFYLSETPKIAAALQFEKVAIAFRARNAPPGIYDINAVVNKQGAWFLEWTPRLGVDAELTSQRAITNLSHFLWRIATGGDVDDMFAIGQAYYDVRLSVPPYPSEAKELEKAKGAVGVAVSKIDGLWNKYFVAVGLAHTHDGFEVADPYGFVGTAVSAGTSLRKGFEDIYAFLKKVRIPNLQYRTDAVKVIAKDIEQMHADGWETTPFMEVESVEPART